jgi:long-chain acyl-CoA synthetase
MKNVVSIRDELQKRSTNIAEKITLKDAESTVTFAELDSRANRISRGLRQAGFDPRDKIAVLLSNHLEWGEIQYGSFQAGVSPAPINVRFAPEQTTAAIESIDADGFIFESQYADLVNSIRDDISIIVREDTREKFLDDQPN